jgi:redox-sensitive bicupin YhaK (pirin superfamily)
MKHRNVERVLSLGEPHFVGDGFRVFTYNPSAAIDMKRMDPFIVIDYHPEYYYSPTDTPRGVGAHPHRGFETVTIAQKGKLAHKDSSGGGGIIETGQTQWMTAGAGVLHSEFHEREFAQEGGSLQMAQIWVNLPAAVKNTAPDYITFNNHDRTVVLPEQNGYVDVLAGSFMNVEGSAKPYSKIEMYNIYLAKGGKIKLNLPAHYNTGMIVWNGNIQVNDEAVEKDEFALMENSGDSSFEINSKDGAAILLLSGEPLNEPIIAHGPFVMNTRDEIVQAYRDYSAGKFGTLDE